MIVAVIVTALWVVGIVFSPFPHWPTYVRLWRALLFSRVPSIDRHARGRQAWLLVRYAVLTPLWTLLWYLDELLYPGYKLEQIRPLFIVGEPRSGTTLLHRTLAADTETFFAVRHIEWRFPFLTIQKLIPLLRIDRLLQQLDYWPSTEEGKQAARMHPNHLYDWEEDGIFYEERFMHHFFVFLRFPYPELLSYVDDFQSLPAHSRRRLLDAHNKVIKKIKYLRGKPNLQYLSKEVTSHDKIVSLLDLYPDARFIFVFRHSSEFMNSLLALMRASTLSKNGIDPAEVPGWEETLVARMRDDSHKMIWLAQEVVHAFRQTRCTFSNLTYALEASVRGIYRDLGEKLGSNYQLFLADLDRHQQSRDSGYVYAKRSFKGFEQLDALVDQVQQEQSLPQIERASSHGE